MKKQVAAFLLMAVMLFSMTACGNTTGNGEAQPENVSGQTEETKDVQTGMEETGQEGTSPEESADGKALVIYFSCTGNTEAVANTISELTGAEMYEIVPEVPYTEDDLNYSNSDSRATKEQNDDSARPAIAGEAPRLSEYDTLYIGYPIWWGRLPKIMQTFFDTYDLSGKTILPFCTSGGSGISASVSEIEQAEPEANVLEGLQINGSSAANCTDAVTDWLEVNDK